MKVSNVQTKMSQKVIGLHYLYSEFGYIAS